MYSYEAFYLLKTYELSSKVQKSMLNILQNVFFSKVLTVDNLEAFEIHVSNMIQ